MASIKNIPVQDVGALKNELRSLAQREFYLEHFLRSGEGEA